LASSDLALPVPAFLDAIGREEATPGGGSVAAVAAAMSAGLVEMAARYSHDWDEAAATVDKAKALRERLASLAAADMEAYEAVLEAVPAERARALAHATDVPARIADVSAEVQGLAALVARCGNQNVVGDARVAGKLAAAAAEAASGLVEINREAARALVVESTSEG
jgi:methenyltetrahydrofolate cyclohydrolase